MIIIILFVFLHNAESEARVVDPNYSNGHNTLFSDGFPFLLFVSPCLSSRPVNFIPLIIRLGEDSIAKEVEGMMVLYRQIGS